MQIGKSLCLQTSGAKKNQEQSELIEKVKHMGKVLHAMTRKVLSLEEEVIELKKNNRSEGMKVFGNLESMKRQEIDVTTDISDQNIFNPSSFSSPKEKKDKQKNFEVKEGAFKCGQCDYKTKKKKNFQKAHLNKS